MTLNTDFLSLVNHEMKVYRKGETIINEGENSAFFFYLNKGILAVFNITSEGKEFIQHKVEGSGFFGEPAILLDKPLPGSVQVMSESAEIIMISRPVFLEFLQHHPAFFLEFTKSIAEKSLRKSDSLKNIIFLNPESRVMKLLKEYKKTQAASSARTKVNLTRKEISHMTGLCVETVIRTIKKMEKEELLEIRSGKIFI